MSDADLERDRRENDAMDVLRWAMLCGFATGKTEAFIRSLIEWRKDRWLTDKQLEAAERTATRLRMEHGSPRLDP